MPRPPWVNAGIFAKQPEYVQKKKLYAINPGAITPMFHYADNWNPLN